MTQLNKINICKPIECIANKVESQASKTVVNRIKFG